MIMKSKAKNSFIIFTIFIFVQGQNLYAGNTTDGVNSTASVQQPSVRNSAGGARDNNSAGSAVAQMMQIGYNAAGQAAAACCATPNPGACCPLAVAMFALGALAGKQSGDNASTAGQASVTGLGADSFGFGNGAYNPLSDQMNQVLAPGVVSDGVKATKNIGKGVNGFKLKDGILTDPKGKEYNVAGMGTPAGMKAAGLPDSVVQSAFEKRDKLGSEILKKINLSGFEEGGGGGSASLNAKPNEDSNTEASIQAEVKPHADRNPAKEIAGLTKDFNGEPIGIANDSIFLMMNRRYQIKDKQDSFFNNITLGK